MSIANQNILEPLQLLYEGGNSFIYYNETSEYGVPVIIKVLKEDYPSPRQIVQFNSEYEFTKDLDIQGIRKAYKQVKIVNKYALMLEYVEGETVKEAFDSTQRLQTDAYNPQRNLVDFLKVAVEIARVIGDIHHQHIIHKDINSTNILVNLEDTEGGSYQSRVHLIDFGISSRIDLKTQHLGNPEVLEGTLAYISPEQTGRMNRVVDYRTDLYSLGVTYYEMLTGKLPFETTDPMELVHCHIARRPRPPSEVNAEIPPMVSEIILKLLAKNAEDRYQSAYGLKFDLERCLEQLEHPPASLQRGQSTIEKFPLGTEDFSTRFQIPQTLYGREQEVKTLLGAFDRVSNGATELMLVAGYSGVGKSSLVHEVHKPIAEKHGYFLAGKYDQYQRNIPYYAIIQAFEAFVRNMLTEQAEFLTAWKAKILQAIGPNGQVLVEMIPGLALLFGPQPPVPEVGPVEAQNRFNYVFQQFIRSISQADHPLVVFLDDLQWADSASLNLLKVLMTDVENRYFLVIGAYRDNEVDESHPLMLILDELRREKTTGTTITLGNLTAYDVRALVADTLYCEPVNVQALADIIYTKTAGNAFFVTQFVQSLYEEGFVTYNKVERGWEWDSEYIQAKHVTENVVELMIRKIQKLPSETQTVLRLASCIGNTFDMTTLSVIYEHNQGETLAHLWSAVEEGLIFPLDGNYKLISVEAPVPENPQIIIKSLFKFLHDRVQQASYSLVPEKDKPAVHWQLGHLLVKNAPLDKREEQIFDIVNHLNIGIKLVVNPSERIELAQLNLTAGRKAKAAAAYQAALKYVQIGLSLLEVQGWQAQYELTLNLHVEAAELAYLVGHFTQTKDLAQVVLEQAKTLLDKIKVYEILVQSLMAENKLVDAIKTALSVLKLLGIRIPETPKRYHFWLTLLKLKLALAGNRVEDLPDQPEMSDPYKLAALRILVRLFTPTAYAAPTLYPFIAFHMMMLLIKGGNTPLSPFVYTAYGAILCFLEDLEAGYRFGKVGFHALQHNDAKAVKTETLGLYGGLIGHWKESIRDEQYLLEGYQSGLDIGELEWAGNCIFSYCWHQYAAGKPLGEIEREVMIYSSAIKHQLKQEMIFYRNEMLHQILLNLRGQAEGEPWYLRGTCYNEEKMLPHHQKARHQTIITSLSYNKLILCFLFQEYEHALKCATEVEHHVNSFAGGLEIPIFHFYDSLTRLAVFPEAPKAEQKHLLNKVTRNQKKMKKWAFHAPMNHLHKWYLVEAERARLLGKDKIARDCYDKAIALAQEHEYLNEEALANELAARFYLANGNTKIAKVYLADARHGYLRWGAIAKVNQLDERYSPLLAETVRKPEALLSSTRTRRVEALDLTTVMRASQAISGEIVLSRLLETMMKIVMENAGAQKGLLILETGGNLVIEAQATIDKEDVRVLQPVPVEESHDVSSAVINYVARTQDLVLLEDAANEGDFTHDPYIVQKKPKSVLCFPFIHLGKLNGMLYLENNLTTGAFTAKRVEVLQLLSSQIAISLENARLYQELEEYSHTLEQKVEQRTAELAQASREAQEARIAAENANHAKSTFLANMSHELRTPINAILGFTQVMTRSQTLETEQQEHLNIIHRSGEHLLTLINNVLDLSKVEAGRITLNEKNFDLYRLLDEVEDMFRLKAEHKYLQLLVKCAAEVPQHVRTDEVKLRQVLMNLLSNAIKFTEEGRVTLRVNTRSTGVLEYWSTGKESPQITPSTLQHSNTPILLSFEIEDTGAGIAPEELDTLFEAFTQTKTGREAQEGTGLGLPISRKFVQLMGGDMSVCSEVGRGTIFKFEIAVRLVDETDLEWSRPSRRVIALESGQPHYRMLIVDDNSTNRRLLIKLLHSFGFELREATNGQEAFEVWNAFKPHLIWMDVRMPVMDGYEATKRIRELETRNSKLETRKPKPPISTSQFPVSSFQFQTVIIAMTAGAFEEERTMALSVGCDDFLRKPFREEEVFEMMHKHLGVRYVYEESQKAKGERRTSAAEDVLTSEAFSALPDELFASLQQAVELIDVEMMDSVIDQIRPQNELLAETLTGLVQQFRFDILHKLFEDIEK